MLQLGEQKNGDHYQHIEPRGLGGYDGSDAVSDEGDNDGSDPENVEFRLFDVIVHPQQHAQNGAAAHKQPEPRRVEYIKQITENADESKCTVGSEERRFPFALEADAPLGQPDKKRKEGYQHESDELLRQIIV
ncbi:hypothetical protein HMPREF1981_03559 [Bacteroides pyogenes F0041]|uniref:Uncharacterized protein n=1 Tax=Bacteroides pyogenes F0041 TaxID=1321819 RepID=U2DH80_9BACE|nr:hypothetical protein HMPREF1981_03559 [Bacteroides pyogenes F0041]